MGESFFDGTFSYFINCEHIEKYHYRDICLSHLGTFYNEIKLPLIYKKSFHDLISDSLYNLMLPQRLEIMSNLIFNFKRNSYVSLQ